MALRNTDQGWGWLSRFFHWALALTILGLFAVGYYMVEILGESTDPYAVGERIELTQLHKSIGFTLVGFVVLRLLWRFMNPTPALPAHMGALERLAAHGGHLALYVLMIVTPVTGWLMASASPLNDPDAYPMQIKNEVFGLFAMPDPYPVGDKALSELFGEIHELSAWAIVIIAAVHALAALKHHFVDKDTVLTRMLGGR